MNKEVSNIEYNIYTIRGQRVMLDEDLAKIYGVETKVLNQTIRRNKERFPENFMFQLTVREFSNLRSQIVTSSYGGRIQKPFTPTPPSSQNARLEPKKHYLECLKTG